MTTIDQPTGTSGTPERRRADNPATASTTRTSRAELGAFLRSRRERLTPEDVGMAPGLRRRTPGLRREEVAQLAGVGVTWYTWLEQGRPIKPSVQVLDAVATTLRFDRAELAHLYRLAGVHAAPEPEMSSPLEPQIQTILDALDPIPAGIYNARFDLLAWNRCFGVLFRAMVDSPPERRNALWHVFTSPSCCCHFVNRSAEMPRMVATFRGYFGRHVGEPAWTDLVERLCAASPAFATLWEGHEVAEPSSSEKVFRHPAVGEVRMIATSLAVMSVPDTRLQVYNPTDDDSREKLAWLADHPSVSPLCTACGSRS